LEFRRVLFRSGIVAGRFVRQACLVCIQTKAEPAHKLKSRIEALIVTVSQSNKPEWMRQGPSFLLTQELDQAAYRAKSGVQLNLSDVSGSDAGWEFSQAAGERKPLQYPRNNRPINVKADHFIIGDANSR